MGQSKTEKTTLSITEISAIAFKNGGVISKPEIDFNLIKKEGGEINIPNLYRAGLKVTFKDDPRPEEGRILNEYMGFYTSIKRHFIITRYYEGSDYILIDNYNHRTSIWNTPIFSGDLKFFVSYKSYGLEGEPIGLQIWEVYDASHLPHKFGLRKILELNQLLFSPEEVKWDSDNSILIRGECIENHFYPDKNSETKYWRIRFN